LAAIETVPPPSRIVWFNADDLGLSHGTDAGIMQAMTKGVVHTTSAMVCDAECRLRVATSAPRLRERVGLHLQLTDGRPLSEPAAIPSLVDGGGRFLRRPSLSARWKTDEVLTEWRAQLAALRELGIEPSHLDSHHHAHIVPGAREAYVEIARELKCRARSGHPWLVQHLRAAGVPCADRCETPWSGDDVSAQDLLDILRAAAEQTPPGALIEISCHPAVLDAELESRSSYSRQRERELGWLCDPALEERLAEIGYRLAVVPLRVTPRSQQGADKRGA
jgi:predicted glycoside hydrolase/deacetylase ChbG (UPF0249 family)